MDQQAQAIAEYEKAVSLSPHDYRFWMSLGTAYEQAGDAAKAEQALRRAVALAPAYSYPRWYLGNLLLRNGRYDEAFAELRIASEADPDLRATAVQSNLGRSTATILKDSRTQSGKRAGCEGAVLRSICSRKSALKMACVCGTTSAVEEKKANRDSGESIITSLKNEYKFHDALKVWNDITSEKYHAEVGRVFDGSFEDAVSYGARRCLAGR